MKLELLSPAKNIDYGREAINHGADAVYMGAPAFGARAAATNSLADTEALVRHAHTYGAKVFSTVNTLLMDDELESASQMIRKLYEMGVDAIIIQDMGLLECDLPPIELHASTQCHNATIERIKFLEQVGFKRIILARETSLQQMKDVRQKCGVALEAFVHGALCVSYSGQCYMSQYLTSRSGNRGRCSQPCRSAYDLYTDSGKLIVKDRHLLSLKDFNASLQLQAMIEAGITSFKIEGRLKDIGYVKNITAFYRQLLDNITEGKGRSASGKCIFHFVPDADRTFNRGYTDYFLRERQPMASFATQKAIGKYIGTVAWVGLDRMTIKSDVAIVPGDGLCFVGKNGKTEGFLVNRVDGNTVVPNSMPTIEKGASLWRSHDQAFEKILSGKSAERRIRVNIRFYATKEGFGLTLQDEDGITAHNNIAKAHQQANQCERMSLTITSQLSKLGDSPFLADAVADETRGAYFLRVADLNTLRRTTVEQLIEHRINHFKPADSPLSTSPLPYPDTWLDYRGNVTNKKAEEFYKSHGVNKIEYGLERTGDYDGKALMTMKYCLRYELGCCLKRDVKTPNQHGIKPTDMLILQNNGRQFRLEFDCGNCQMKLFKH